MVDLWIRLHQKHIISLDQYLLSKHCFFGKADIHRKTFLIRFFGLLMEIRLCEKAVLNSTMDQRFKTTNS